MKNVILLIISALPVILIGYFIYNKDREKEPLSIIIKTICGGVASCFIVMYITDILSLFIPMLKANTSSQTYMELIIHALVGVALIEELSKLLMLYNISYNDKNFDETYDMIIYSVFVSLGFALIENILYVFRKGITIGLIRALISIPAHTCNGIFMGYYLMQSKIFLIKNDNIKRQKNIIFSLLVPTILHGIYDYCLFIGNEYSIIFFFIFIIVLFIVSIKKVITQANNSKKIEN